MVTLATIVHGLNEGLRDVAGTVEPGGLFNPKVNAGPFASGENPATEVQAEEAAATKKTAAKKKATTPKPETAKEIETEIADNPFNKLGEGLTTQLKAAETPIESAIAGGLTAPAESSAATQALGALGLSPNSSASSWLNSEISQANANDSPMDAAMKAYGSAFDTSQGTVNSALTQMGTANALETTTAPEQEWLTALMSHIQSNLSYYGEAPTDALASLPPALLYYLQQSGAGGAIGGAGTSNVSELKVPGAAKYGSNTKLPTTALPSVVGAAPGATNTSIPSDVGTAPS
jgi:hypothetical protein